jgi:hypothetical protein
MLQPFGRIVMLLVPLALAASVRAQAAPPAPMTPMERAQRDADKVYYWVKLHGQAQPRPAPGKEAASAASATTLAKKPAPPLARAAAASAPSSASTATEPADAQAAAEPPSEAPALN